MSNEVRTEDRRGEGFAFFRWHCRWYHYASLVDGYCTRDSNHAEHRAYCMSKWRGGNRCG